jgi:uncharacterized membrane protein YfcA
MLTALLIALALAALVYAAKLIRAAAARAARPHPEAIAIGAVTNFFDTLGIGSFAPTMAWFKLRHLVDDRLIPSTMLVGHTLPVMTQAVIFLILLGVMVDPLLLGGCIVAVFVGALVGAPLVAKTRVWIVQSIVGGALVLAALLYALANLDLMPGGGAAASLPIALTIAAIAANFLFGVLLNFGVGNYAPTLVMLSLMGMDPRLSFPIMAGGAALAAAGAGVRHIARGGIDLRIAIGVALGGVPAVLVAAFVVKSMSVELLRWLVIIVVLYAAAAMIRSAVSGRRAERRNRAAGAPAIETPLGLR